MATLVQPTLEVVSARTERAQKPRRKQLPDLENAAVQDELRKLKEKFKTLRKVGTELGYPKESAQATISAALKGRAGRELAAALYRYLKMSREDFLVYRGVGPARTLAPEVVSDRSSWSAMGLSEDAAERLAATVRAELEALHAPSTRPPPRLPAHRRR